jgi:hypothetical protein
MDEETQRELRRKKLCYSCKEPWEPGHRCMGKGKLHYIEVLSYEEDDGDDKIAHLQDSGQGSGEPPHLDTTEKAPLQEGAKGVTIATVLGVPKYYTFRVRGILQVQRVTTVRFGSLEVLSHWWRPTCGSDRAYFSLVTL